MGLKFRETEKFKSIFRFAAVRYSSDVNLLFYKYKNYIVTKDLLSQHEKNET